MFIDTQILQIPDRISTTVIKDWLTYFNQALGYFEKRLLYKLQKRLMGRLIHQFRIMSLSAILN